MEGGSETMIKYSVFVAQTKGGREGEREEGINNAGER